MCVAGLDFSSARHVRPVSHGRLPTSLLASNGGPFAVAAIVDLGAVRSVGVAPEVEDHRFEPPLARRVGELDDLGFWSLLCSVAHGSLSEAFGPSLRRVGGTCAVPEGEGSASLACIRPSSPPSLRTDENTVRLILRDHGTTLSIAVTDLRLFEADGVTPRSATVEALNRQFGAGAESVLALGLTRPWQRPDMDAPMHWLQVNNIHLEDASARAEANL